MCGDDIVTRVRDGGQVDDRVATAEGLNDLVVFTYVDFDETEVFIFLSRALGKRRWRDRLRAVNANHFVAVRDGNASDSRAEIATGSGDCDLHVELVVDEWEVRSSNEKARGRGGGGRQHQTMRGTVGFKATEARGAEY